MNSRTTSNRPANAKSAQRRLAQRAAARRARAPKRAPAGQRRSFSQSNLELRHDGPLGPLLVEALTVPEESGYQLTHGFHPYPGRFHPLLPRTLLRALARPESMVLDPFMGGGTTLVEAMLHGAPSIGNDLNPIAVLVARERTRPRTAVQAAKVVAEARRIASLVETLRRDKRAPRHHMPQYGRVAPHYMPHLLAELMQWVRLIEALPGDPEGAAATRETLRAVFSSAAVKYSNQPSDSQTEGASSPSVPKGAVSRFLVAKCQELTRAQITLAERLPRPIPPVRLLQEDARLLPSLGWAEADWIVTSPPYPGTYDYHAQHALRMAWLGIDGSTLEAGEMAPRREQELRQPAPAPPVRGKGRKPAPAEKPAPPRPDSWSATMRDALVAMARVLRPGGGLLIVLGDWLDDGHAVDASAMLTRAAEDKGWNLHSRAAARREAFSHKERRAYAKRGKWEHLLYFSRS
jgi:DNA modification methylase